ncbi:MAG TPA: GNAT family N-acetyltransferase [Salinivirgaceae bacterium]|nr:GNAT family N-acetyltransferase [Salinivirgaceae bacterium]
MFLFRPFKIDDKEQVIELLHGLWIFLSETDYVKHFDWKYLQANHTFPNAFVAVDKQTNGVIGFRGFVIQKYTINNNTYTAAVISDACVNPNYRRKGILSKMTMFGINYLKEKNVIDFYLVLSSNTASIAAYLKIGFQIIDCKKELYKILIKNKPSNKYEYQISNTFSTNKLMLNNSSKIKINNTEEFLKWRYKNPNTNYEYVYVYEKGELVVFISYYYISTNRIYILDYNFSNLSAFKEAFKYLKRNKKIKFAQVWGITCSNDKKKILKQVGFFSLTFIRTKILRRADQPILIRPATIKISENDFFIENIDIRDPQNWELNLINSDGV